MARIIKRATSARDVKYHYLCECGSVIEYTERDAEVTHAAIRCPGEALYYVTCPVCVKKTEWAKVKNDRYVRIEHPKEGR